MQLSFLELLDIEANAPTELFYSPPQVSDKPVMIFACSGAKDTREALMPAFERYEGDMYKFVRNTFPQLTERFNVFILSAKFGLIHSGELIPHYDLEMSEVDPELYQQVHRESALKKLKTVSKGQPVYVVMPNGYTDALKTMLKSDEAQSVMKRMGRLYICHGHRGNGDQKTRVRQIVEAEFEGRTPTPRYAFRSGVAANKDEWLAYLSAGEAICASLYYMHDKPEIHTLLTLSLAQVPVLVDNGAYTLMTKNKAIVPSVMIEQYEQLLRNVTFELEHLKARYPSTVSPEEFREYVYGGYQPCDLFEGMTLEKLLSNLLFVIPDNPHDPEGAIRLIREFEGPIRHMANLGVQWMLPIHKNPMFDEKSDDIQQRLARSLDILQGVDVIVGIPTVGSKALPESHIEKILCLKDSNKESRVTKVHFLGQGDTTRYQVYRNRLELASLYGVDFTCDSNRTVPIMTGNKATLSPKITRADFERKWFLLQDKIAEFIEDEDDSSAIEDRWNELLYDDAEAFVRKWNLGITQLRLAHLPEFALEDVKNVVEACGSFRELEGMDIQLSDDIIKVFVAAHIDEIAPEITGNRAGNSVRMAYLQNVFSTQACRPERQRLVEWGEFAKQEVDYL